MINLTKCPFFKAPINLLRLKAIDCFKVCCCVVNVVVVVVVVVVVTGFVTAVI